MNTNTQNEIMGYLNLALRAMAARTVLAGHDSLDEITAGVLRSHDTFAKSAETGLKKKLSPEDTKKAEALFTYGITYLNALMFTAGLPPKEVEEISKLVQQNLEYAHHLKEFANRHVPAPQPVCRHPKQSIPNGDSLTR